VSSLAEIAIEAGLANRDKIGKAAEIAEKKRVPLVVALVRDCGVDELGLVTAIRKQFRVPLIDPAKAKLDPEALRGLSRDVARRLRVLPLSVSVYDSGPNTMHVATADPTDQVTLAEVEHLSGCRVECSLMPLSAIEELVESSYRAFVTEVMRRGRNSDDQPAGKSPFGPAPTADAAPTTIPYHRVSDDADVAVRVRALVDLLLHKRVITEDEYEEQVRLLMKRQDEGG